MEANKTSTGRNDFASHDFIQRNQHNRDINAIKKRLGELEERVGDNEKFAKTFCEARKTNKAIDEGINEAIDAHDNHKLKVNGVALLKWLSVLVVGGVIGALITIIFKK